jgi:hypothetical protein
MLFFCCRENLDEGGIWDLYVHFGCLAFVTLCPPVASQQVPDWKCRRTLCSFLWRFSLLNCVIFCPGVTQYFILSTADEWMNEYEVSVECYWQVKPTCSEKTLPGATTNFMWAGLESNPGLCSEKPALNRLTFCSRGKQATVISRAGVLPFSERNAGRNRACGYSWIKSLIVLRTVWSCSGGVNNWALDILVLH